MAGISIEEMNQQSVAVLPERAALGHVKVIKINAYNSAEAHQAITLLSSNSADAGQVIIVG